MELGDIPRLTGLLGLPAEAIWSEVVSRRGKAVWRIDCPGRSYAARLFRPGWFRSARIECRAMLLARCGGLPVAPVRASAQLRGRPVLLVDWCPGHDLYAELRQRPWAAERLGAAFGEQQAMLHRVPVAGNELPDWIDFFGPIDEPLRRRLRQAQGPPRMLHLDYNPYNVALEGGRISGLLDWTNARTGDPRADLARTWTIGFLLHRSGRVRPLRRLAESRFFEGWWRGYVRMAGPQAEMPVFLAWAVHGLLHIELRQKPQADEEQIDLLLRLTGRVRAAAGLPKIGEAGLLGLAAA